MSGFHDLAQVNIMRLRASLDSPDLAPFVAALDPVNALADGAPGFVWRSRRARCAPETRLRDSVRWLGASFAASSGRGRLKAAISPCCLAGIGHAFDQRAEP
jgi:hypothetical protein